MKFKAYAATMQGVWFSENEGVSWSRLITPTQGLYNEARVWAVHTHKERPGELLAGTDQGLYRYTEETRRFDYIPSPMDNLHILQIARDPHDASSIVCGTRPSEIFISQNDGETWTRSNFDSATECWFINTPRVTSINFDPKFRDTIWVTVEIDGVFRSDDRGKSWKLLIAGLRDNDTHDLVFRDDGDNRSILVSTENGIHRSENKGETWQHVPTPEAPFTYFRSLACRADDSGFTIASVGDKPSGETGLLLVSPDFGKTWRRATISNSVNSTIWSLATNPANPMLLFAATIFGQIYRSQDGGETWEKMPRELGEIRKIAWAPVP